MINFHKYLKLVNMGQVVHLKYQPKWEQETVCYGCRAVLFIWKVCRGTGRLPWDGTFAVGRDVCRGTGCLPWDETFAVERDVCRGTRRLPWDETFAVRRDVNEISQCMYISHIYHVPFMWKECLPRRFSSSPGKRGSTKAGQFCIM